jgi:hypothetical protein
MPDEPATNIDLIRQASWIAKCAADWAGGTACPPNQLGELVRPEVLQRFRADILSRLDAVAPAIS